jgi:uncharacterized protein (TIGR03790 family)
MVTANRSSKWHQPLCTGVACLAAAILTCALQPYRALAGTGPENVLVVVNGDSTISMQIANSYIKMRDIPPEHVLWLYDIPYTHRISIGLFRKHIWNAIREFITRNRLDEEIDIIAYSSGFPYAINFSADLDTGNPNNLKFIGKEASLTGLTYFARHVETRDTQYLARNANRYFRRRLAKGAYMPRALTGEEAHLITKAHKAFLQKDMEEAIANYESLTRSYPEHGGFWYDLARSHSASGNRKEALEALEKAVNNGWSNSLETRTDKDLKVLAEEPVFRHLLARMEQANSLFQESHGFSSQYEWTGTSRPVKTLGSDSLHSYYLSTMLAYTGLNGNSVPEVENYLAAARSSDSSWPDGTVYLLANNNIRSTTRQPLFLATVEAMKRRGHRAEILTAGEKKQDGILPKDKADVIGAVVGAKKFNWQNSGSRLLPGAIVESLTSYGAQFNNNSQTKLTEFLRYGAAGSSGTVAEPFSIQAKFPVPMLHVYYADGCSLAEAFYQSVESPYQLLVVGDPLARPYAHFASIALTAPGTDKPWSGIVTLKPTITPAPGRPLDHLELWIDGQLVAYALPDEAIRWDTRSLDDGYHDLRLIAEETNPVETRSSVRMGVMINNNNHQMELDPLRKQFYYSETITISGSATDGHTASIWQGSRKLASVPIKQGRWQFDIDCRQLGTGPVTLRADATFLDKTVTRSKPIKLHILPPPPSGKVITETGQTASKTSTVRLRGNLRDYENVEYLIMDGQLTAEETGFYEIVVTGPGKISLAVDDISLLSNETLGHKQTRFLPITLAKGTHTLKIEFSPDGNRAQLRVVLEGEHKPVIPEVRVVKAVRKTAHISR